MTNALQHGSQITWKGLLTSAVILTGITAIIGTACTFVGPLPVIETTGGAFWKSLIWQDRLSRVIAALVAGGGLSMAGLALQALLRNPLANPYILGVSSGAGVGVIVGMSLAARAAAPAFATTPVLAFLGALSTLFVVYGVSTRRGQLDPYALILTGVVISSINGALILSIYLFIDPHTLASFVTWSMGHVPDAVDPRPLAVCSTAIVASCAWIFLRSAAYNTLGLGDAVATSSGVPVKKLRIETFIGAGLCTAAAVAMVGPIGFVGLIVPHVMRMVVGPDHRRLSIYSFFAGAIFLASADSMCRFVGYYAHLGRIPVGIVTAFMGGPFFIWLLRTRDKARFQ